MTRIFLSYGRGDDVQPFEPATSFLTRLYRDLTAADFDVWFDRVSMPSRRLTFHQEIRDAVAAASGIGKSVLAAAVARDRRIREAFPDGIVWITLGQSPNVVALQRQVHQALGGDEAFAENQGRAALAERLANRATLLVLDDVSRTRRLDVNAFDVLGPRCRALIAARDAAPA